MTLVVSNVEVVAQPLTNATASSARVELRRNVIKDFAMDSVGCLEDGRVDCMDGGPNRGTIVGTMGHTKKENRDSDRDKNKDNSKPPAPIGVGFGP